MVGVSGDEIESLAQEGNAEQIGLLYGGRISGHAMQQCNPVSHALGADLRSAPPERLLDFFDRAVSSGEDDSLAGGCSTAHDRFEVEIPARNLDNGEQLGEQRDDILGDRSREQAGANLLGPLGQSVMRDSVEAEP